jgi:hypothetical protein
LRDIARLRSSEQIAADGRVGFRHAAIKFITKALAQRLRGAADDLGDVILTSSGGRAGLFFAASPAMPGFEIKACLVAPRGGRQVKAPGISVKTLSPE